MRMLLVSGSCQNYQNGAVSNQLTGDGRGRVSFGGGGVTEWICRCVTERLFRTLYSVTMSLQKFVFKYFLGFFFVLYSALLHLPPLRFHLCGLCRRMLRSNPGPLQLSDALTTRLDLIHSRLDLIRIAKISSANVEISCGWDLNRNLPPSEMGNINMS